MSRHNRFVALALVLVLAVSLLGFAGCKPKVETVAKKVGLVFDIGGLGDKSFNDSAYAGLVRAQEDFDIETFYLEPTAGGEDREMLLRTLCENGYELVFAVGFAFAAGVAATATDFPNVMFVNFDGYVANLTEGSNIVCIGFPENEGSFLVGIAAAMKSQAGHIGFVGGMEMDLIKKFEAGFRAGAAFINPTIKCEVNYIGTTFDAFKNPTVGRELALAQINKGADVVYHASGQSGVGVIQACAEKSVWTIGVDSDQYAVYADNPEQQVWIMTSMLKRVDNGVYDTIEKFINGEFKGGYVLYGIKDEGVGYATTNTTALTANIVTRIEEVKAQIVSGEIVVPVTPAEADAFIADLQPK